MYGFLFQKYILVARLYQLFPWEKRWTTLVFATYDKQAGIRREKGIFFLKNIKDQRGRHCVG